MVDRDESRSGSASLGLARLFHPSVVSPRCVHSQTPLQAAMAFGPRLPHLDSCSARVVSHHLDGLLRTGACGFVAPRFRPWGSLRFVPSVPRLRRGGGDRVRSSPQRGHTLQRVPLVSSRTASLRPLPPCLLPRTRTPPTLHAHRCAHGSEAPPHPKALRWAEVDVGGALVHRGEPPHRCRSFSVPGVNPARRPSFARPSTTVRDLRCQRTLPCGSGPRAAGFEALLH
jgi:hypothetical protein